MFFRSCVIFVYARISYISLPVTPFARFVSFPFYFPTVFSLLSKPLSSVTISTFLVSIISSLNSRIFNIVLDLDERHETWYSWGIGALTGCVYTFGFVLMCPQVRVS